MKAFKDNDRIIMILDDETYRSFEYKGRKALAIEKTCKELEDIISETSKIGTVQALSAPVQMKEGKSKSEEIRRVFEKDIETASVAEVGNFLFKLRKDPKAQKIIERRYGHVSMDFVIHCKGERELKELAYDLLSIIPTLKGRGL